jgi:hypothetical protein
VNHITLRDAPNRLVDDGTAIRIPYKGALAMAA